MVYILEVNLHWNLIFNSFNQCDKCTKLIQYIEFKNENLRYYETITITRFHFNIIIGTVLKSLY